MNIEFHYYVTYAIARQCGFSTDEAYIIAYSSQYIDDNRKSYVISNDTSDEYENFISQTLDITKRPKKLRRIWLLHFMPGPGTLTPDMALKDGRQHLLQTVPGNENARTLLREALESGNLYKIGIACHVFADTWAHQNFTGSNSEFNAMKGVDDAFVPNIGHADARHDPDKVGGVWTDGRLRSPIVMNNGRFIQAAMDLASEISRATGTLHRKLDRYLLAIFSDKVENKRLWYYRGLIGQSSFREYDKDAWFSDAVERKGRLFPKYRWRPGWKNSHWFRFQEAVKEQQARALELLKPILDKVEISRF